jgi:hypothetical protein
MLDRHRPRRRAIGIAAVMTFGAVVSSLTAAPSASAACAAKTTRSISGVVYGADGMDVNVSIGFDVAASNGKIINVSDGCAKSGGYSAPQQEKNHYVSGNGVPKGSRMQDEKGRDRGVTTRTWKLGSLPSNATSVWIEVYSRGYNGSPCTACFSPSDTHKYGYVMRRQVKVGSTGVVLKLPTSCSYSGGTMGGISGQTKNSAGASVKADNVYAWSMAPDSNTRPLGWGSASKSVGRYNLSALAAGQKYAVWFTYKGVTQKRLNVQVNACKSTPLNVKV